MSDLGWGGGETVTHETPHEFTTNEILRAIGKEIRTIKSIAVFFFVMALINGVLAVLFFAGAFG